MSGITSSAPSGGGLLDDELQFLATTENPSEAEGLWRVYESHTLGTLFPTLDERLALADIVNDTRIRNAFDRKGVRTWSDLRGFTIRQALDWRNLGARSVGVLLGSLARTTLRPLHCEEEWHSIEPGGPPDSEEHGVGPTPAPATREQLMVQMRLSGDTLDKIGAEFGITRERVRQIIAHVGGPTAQEVRAAKAAAIQAAVRAESDRVDSLLRPLLHTRGALTAEEASAELGIEQSMLVEYWPEDLHYLRVWEAAYVDQIWSDDQIFAALREAALYEYPVTAKTYAELVRVGQVRGPSLPRIHQRFTGWTAACDAAGVESGQPHRDNYQSRWTDAELLQFARDYFLDPDWPASAHRYDEWRRIRVPDGPSGMTLRNRLGTWSTIKRLALRPGEVVHD